MKKIKIAYLILSVFFIIFGSGCISSDDEPANISLSILQMKMQKAMDPDGLFRKSKSYVQKQMLIVKEGWEDEKGYIVEIKYKRPDKMLMVKKEDNVPTTALIFNGQNAWIVDYQKKSRTLIKGEQLERMKVLFALGRPGSKYQDIFKDVKLFETTLDGQPYYKLKCISKFKDQEPLIVYVGRDNFLTKRIDIPPYVTSVIDKYGLYDGVIIPEQITETTDGSESAYKLIMYKLNVEIKDEEFFPPKF